MAGEDWKVFAARRRQSLLDKIPVEWRLGKDWSSEERSKMNQNVLSVPRESGILSERELDITENYDATALVQKLASGEFSSYEVTLAFSKRAAIAHQVVRLLCLSSNFH
jgi:amidase